MMVAANVRALQRQPIAAFAATGRWILPEVWKTLNVHLVQWQRRSHVSHTSLDGFAAHSFHRPGGLTL